MKPIILASKSPRRKELLQMLGYDFIVKAGDIDETILDGLSPQQFVLELSKRKAEVIAVDYPDHIVIGADTIVVHHNHILGKPVNQQDAANMLKRLSNATHQVITGVTIYYQGKSESFYNETEVQFYPLTTQEIIDYINTNEPYDKAGGYAIQGQAAKFIKTLKGDYFNVVGLPIGEMYQRLKKYFTN